MISEWLSIVDLLVAGLILLFAIGGYQRGFAGQIAHVGALLVLGGGLYFGYPALFRYLSGRLEDANETYLMWLLVLGFLVFVVVAFLLLSKLLTGFLKAQVSERTDHVLGFVLGLVRGGLVVMLGMVLLAMVGPQRMHEHLRLESRSGRFVCETVVPRIQPHFDRETIGSKVESLRGRLLQQRNSGFNR